MQVLEAEIFIPITFMQTQLKSTFRSLRNMLVIIVIGFVCWLGLEFRIATGASQFPDVQQSVHQNMIFVSIIFTLILILYALYLRYIYRKTHAPVPNIRINHEGIFTVYDSFVVKWAEIKEMSATAMFGGSPHLRIIPWNIEEVVARARVSPRFAVRLGANIQWWLSRYLKFPARISISQIVLSVSINELLATIQEQFATELREHHIVVQGKQH